MLTSKAILPLAALVVGVGAYVYFTREKEASAASATSGGNGVPLPDPEYEPQLLVAMTTQEHAENVEKMTANPKPIVLIVFKAGQIGARYPAIQAAGNLAAKDYPNIWVVAESHAVRLEVGSQGVDTHCGPDDIGYVLAAPVGGGAGSEVGVNCWQESTLGTKVRQDILAAAMAANGLVGNA
jgi:hypothetical protein